MNSVRHIFLIATSVLVLTFWFAPPSLAQSSAADELNQRVIELYKHGRYADAIPLAQRALAIREKALGREHPDVAAACYILAFLYDKQGRYAEAEAFDKRVLAILEKLRLPNHPDVAMALDGLAGVYEGQGRYCNCSLVYWLPRSEDADALLNDSTNKLWNINASRPLLTIFLR